MSKNKDYQRLLNSKKWKDLRTEYLQQHPLCERCKANGSIRAAIDIHHRQPVESFTKMADMERACYDWSNLMALCVPCHQAIHKEMGKNTKKNRQERAKQAFQRWIERISRKS